ncbi:MAG: hypothetical protein WAK93_19120 [Solirubrobacteraceae bacterium]
MSPDRELNDGPPRTLAEQTDDVARLRADNRVGREAVAALHRDRPDLRGPECQCPTCQRATAGAR